MRSKVHSKNELKEKKAGSKWLLAALLLSIVMIALIMISTLLIKDKLTTNYYISNPFRAGDMALFVAMPVLNAVLK